MKICPQCKKKSLKFRAGVCNSCDKKNKRERNYRYVIDYLRSHGCSDCSETNPLVLQFDHVRGDKRKSISYMAKNGYSLDTIEEEISKCDIRCANCHTKKTLERAKAYPYLYLVESGYISL